MPARIITYSLGTLVIFATLFLSAGTGVAADDAAAQSNASTQPVNLSWPRVFEKDGKKLTMYQPQVDSWTDYTVLHFRCAVSIEGVLKDERFGVAEIDAQTVVDQPSRLVAITPLKRGLRFAGVSNQDEAKLKEAAEMLHPPSAKIIISIERVLAYLDASKEAVQRTVDVNMAPPKIYYSAEPAILVIFMGDPRIRPVAADRKDLQFVLNTNWDILQDTASGKFYLLNGEGWLSSLDLLKGPWAVATQLPASFSTLPEDENWSEVRKAIPGKPAASAPKVFASVEPAELIVTDGAPEFEPIAGTKLAQVSNTQNVLLRDSAAGGKFYLLDAGRWFSASELSGPWAAATKDLPADFADIPNDSPVEFAKASVPGTDDAKDALLLASVPDTIIVKRNVQPVEVVYNGEPKFHAIAGTKVQCALNSSQWVFKIDNGYYCCDEGVWFQANNAKGPWVLCDRVPGDIYTIPASHPAHNVTYVKVVSYDANSVTFSQTAGYQGEYVSDAGTLVFGSAEPINVQLSDSDDDYYYSYAPYPYYYSYGCGAMYSYGYGGYYSPGYPYYGPYGGVGYVTGYNPATGFYRRAAYAYGPYRSAVRRAAYNPNTGAFAASARVSGPYGSAGRFVAYNPSTGNYARGGYVNSRYGGAAAVKTSQGSGAVVWDTRKNQGGAVKTKSGDIYAGRDGTVYKKDADGGWSKNSGNGWQDVTRPPRADAGSGAIPATARQGGQISNRPVMPDADDMTRAANRNRVTQRDSVPVQQRNSYTPSYRSQSRDSMDFQSQARNRGIEQTQRSNQFRSSASGGGGVRPGGGRR